MHTDYLILGSGIAGLTVAIKLAEKFPERKVLIATKSNEDESNTKYAQGGIAVVTDTLNDNFKKHINDTLLCGDGLCNKETVEMVVKEGPKRIEELIEWGTQFDLTPEGKFELAKEGGHSDHRVVHHKDQTGQEIERAILFKAHQKKNIKILDFHFAIDLIMDSEICRGAILLNEKKGAITPVFSSFTIMATGGIGQVYKQTTNPIIATGDGIAMAARANATIKDMEFIQFHPTALYTPNSNATFLISEAVRGFGGYLKTKNGNRFMFNYDSRGELASRDIVSRSIEIELKKLGNSCVYLDCTHLDILKFKNHFPTIYQNCLRAGIDIAVDWIPVTPTQHYLCGGIAVDKNGLTSLKNLFACGECSYTGLHGANRLASNSLLEALVYAHRIFELLKTLNSKKTSESYTFHKNIILHKKPVYTKKVVKYKTDLQNCMQENAGIVRTNKDLKKAQKKLLGLEKKCQEIESKYIVGKDFYELKNMVLVSILIVDFSIKRNENKGCFFKKL